MTTGGHPWSKLLLMKVNLKREKKKKSQRQKILEKN